MSQKLTVTTGGHYLAFVLSDQSRQRMIELCDHTGRTLKCTHVTVAYDYGEADLPVLQAFIDSAKRVQVTGILKGSGITCFDVIVDNNHQRPLSSYFHLTHSIDKDHSSSDSNKFYTGEYNYVYEPTLHTLTGSFQLVPKEE